MCGPRSSSIRSYWSAASTPFLSRSMCRRPTSLHRADDAAHVQSLRPAHHHPAQGGAGRRSAPSSVRMPRATGAVNVVRFDPGGRLVGEIFDGNGLIVRRRNGIEVHGSQGSGARRRRRRSRHRFRHGRCRRDPARAPQSHGGACRGAGRRRSGRIPGLDVAATGTDATGGISSSTLPRSGSTPATRRRSISHAAPKRTSSTSSRARYRAHAGRTA